MKKKMKKTEATEKLRSCKDCKYFYDGFCHHIGQDEEGILTGTCPYGKTFDTLENLFGAEKQENDSL